MRLARFWRHVVMTPARARRAFPPATLHAIQREIAAQERRHGGQVSFIVEAELHTAALWRDVSARERARQLFALHGVWNTEHNNGVLVYVLLAERRVEIVADRGIQRLVAEADWRRILQVMDPLLRQGRYEEAAIAGVRGVSDLLAAHFPPLVNGTNELSDRPLVL
ncbi:MAG TPA: TPM domain-containing protein [Usitatibacter sp.]|jgi:uncharacterized membrane protein|nr:TPM domain-containing protein [Usitatibacter sp.]